MSCDDPDRVEEPAELEYCCQQSLRGDRKTNLGISRTVDGSDLPIRP